MEMGEFNRNLEEYQEKLSTYAFAMFRYKTSWCPKIGQKHDWAQCIYAHRLQDFRRPPDFYDYEPEDWAVIIHKDWSWESWQNGLDCKFSHTTFERLYHPSRFKLVPWEKKVWTRADMCGFFHQADEKLKVEQESEAFYDPLLEEYDEEGWEKEFEDECFSDNRSPKSYRSNTNTNTNNISQEYEENDSATKPESKFSLPSTDNFTFEDGSEENVWANEEFGLEAALQKAHSQTQKEEFEAIFLEQELARDKQFTTEKEPFKQQEIISPFIDKSKQAKEDEKVSSEIKNLVLGNSQQMATSMIVQNIVSDAPTSSKSKFFDFKEDKKENEEDSINDILSMDYNTFCLENNSKPKCANTNTFYPYQELNSLYVIHEEGEILETAYSNKSIGKNFQS